MARKGKPETVTFKVDADLLEAMRGIPNRSEFIRAALLAALESVCPLCSGTGLLTPGQKRHWEAFARDHAMAECDECHELHVVCTSRPDGLHAERTSRP
jgi:hypothetical protein